MSVCVNAVKSISIIVCECLFLSVYVCALKTSLVWMQAIHWKFYSRQTGYESFVCIVRFAISQYVTSIVISQLFKKESAALQCISCFEHNIMAQE